MNASSVVDGIWHQDLKTNMTNKGKRQMNIEDIEANIKTLRNAVDKLEELIADAKVCSSDITKALIMSAIKKYAAAISGFTVE